MTPADVDRVFGRGRVKMVTGEHVEVYREAALPGERRRYTKRFLATEQGDFRHWTEREWRILARLVGHRIGPVPDVVQFDRGDASRPALVQTYDAGITVDHWATLLPVERHGHVLRHVFEDCAHWWALAQHCLAALDAIHELQLVHLDLKADNVCIPLVPADFDPRMPGAVLHPLFTQVTLIDFAFSLVSGENLATALPIAHQGEYDYQSPRLLRALEAGRRGDLQPTRQLDWRCDVFSLAAMLRRYLPQRGLTEHGGWTESRLAQAQGLVSRLFDAHHGPLPARRPHRQWITFAERVLNDPALAASLAKGWQLTSQAVAAQLDGPTPVTRIAVPVAPLPLAAAAVANEASMHAARRAERVRRLVWASGALALGALAVPLVGETWLARRDAGAPVAAVDPAASSASAPEVVVAQAPEEASVPVAAPAVASAPATANAPAAANAPAMPSAPAAAEVATASASAAPASSAAVETAAASAVEPKHEVQRQAQAKPAPAPTVAAVASPRAAPAVVAAPKPTSTSPRATATASARKAAHMASIAKAALKPAPTSRFAAKRFVLPAIPPPPTPDPAPAAVMVSQATLPVSAPAPPAPAPAAPVPSPASAPAAPPAAVANPFPGSAPVSHPRATDDGLVPAPLPSDFAERADDLLIHHLPRIAQRAERRVLRVLHVASQAESSWQNSAIFDAARALRMPPDDVVQGVKPASSEARSLHDAAGAAFWSGRNVQRALSLQLRAFGADPNDREVAGNLAYYYLKQRPVQPELARQLALYALTLDDAQAPNGRVEDWTSLAIASALTGRTRDATNAWFVTLALSPQNVDRSCRAALAAYASHGERLREPTEAMLSRISAWGRSQESPFCRWPPSWSARVRTP